MTNRNQFDTIKLAIKQKGIYDNMLAKMVKYFPDALIWDDEEGEYVTLREFVGEDLA